MLNRWNILIRGIACLCAGGILLHASPSDQKSTPPDRSFYLSGKRVYQVSCQPCHGERGKGDGELVTEEWEVSPRDLTLGEFKYRSTPYGKLPTNQDLKRTILRGIAGSAMPTFHDMTDKDLTAVIEYVKYFSRTWRNETYHAEAETLPLMPESFKAEANRREAILSGATLYAQICAPCHGEHGTGDGVAAAALTDSKGDPIRPANLLVPLGCGDRPEDILRTIMTGMTGTPMPSFGEALTPTEAWQIVLLLMDWRLSKVASGSD